MAAPTEFTVETVLERTVPTGKQRLLISGRLVARDKFVAELRREGFTEWADTVAAAPAEQYVEPKGTA